MFAKDVNCNIYIGRHAGKQIKQKIANATQSLCIVSPYISPKLLFKLIDAKQRGVDVTLITQYHEKNFKNFRSSNMEKKFIKQNITIDNDGVIQRNKFQKIYNKYRFLTLFTFILLLSLLFYLEDVRILYSCIIVLFLFIKLLSYSKKIKNTRIYNYSYESIFNIYAFEYKNIYGTVEKFVHSKIYIIDNKIAYIGSLNFTYSGLEQNHETRIKITNQDVINKINDELKSLLTQSDITQHSIQAWGQKIYPEPIN